MKQYESNYRVQTKTRHQAPMIRASSVVSSDNLLQADSRNSLRKAGRKVRKVSSTTSTPEIHDANSDSSHSMGREMKIPSNNRLMSTLDDMNRKLEDHSKKLSKLQLDFDKIYWAPRRHHDNNTIKTILYIIFGIILQTIVSWLIHRKSA